VLLTQRLVPRFPFLDFRGVGLRIRRGRRRLHFTAKKKSGSARALAETAQKSELAEPRGTKLDCVCPVQWLDCTGMPLPERE
jgi:hypothetical protein